MNRITLSDDQLQFFIDSQEARIKKLEVDFADKQSAKMAMMDYITSLGKEHVLACAKFLHERTNTSTEFLNATAYWHDQSVDLSPLNALNEHGEVYFKPWSDDEKSSEIK